MASHFELSPKVNSRFSCPPNFSTVTNAELEKNAHQLIIYCVALLVSFGNSNPFINGSQEMPHLNFTAGIW